MKTVTFFLSVFCVITHTLFADANWERFKQETLTAASSLVGWYPTHSENKTHVMMNLIKENQLKSCIEIGVLCGASLYPMARALRYNGSGIVYGIDAWEPSLATSGFSRAEYNHWSKLNYNLFYETTCAFIRNVSLESYCNIIRQPSQKAVNLFGDETIDLIHFDGNWRGENALADVTYYLPKIRDGGFIFLSNANHPKMIKALVFLLERTELASPFTRSATYIIFRKNKRREQKTKALLKNEAISSPIVFIR